MWRLCHLQQLTALVCSVWFATLQLVWDVTLHSYCLKTTHWHVLFFHSHNTLQILIGDSKVTSKLAKIIHLFLILWWCLISYFRTLQLVRVVDLFFKTLCVYRYKSVGISKCKIMISSQLCLPGCWIILLRTFYLHREI